MLFKVFMLQSFADEGDRIGVIQANSMEEAVAKLRKYNEETCDWGAYEYIGEPEIKFAEDFTIISYDVAELNEEQRTGNMGKDDYAIRPISSDILMFLAEDWNLIFD